MKTIDQIITESAALTPTTASITIANKYLAGINELPWEKQQHFLNRLRLCNGFEGCMDDKQEYELYKKIVSSIEEIYNYYKGKFNTKNGFNKLIVSKYDDGFSERKKHNAQYLKTIESSNIMKLLLAGLLMDRASILFRMGKKDVFMLNSQLWDGVISVCQDIPKDIESVPEEDWYNLIDNVPVNIVNLLYYTLDVCRGVDIDDGRLTNFVYKVRMKLMNDYNRVIADKTNLNGILNIVYAITHIIIGASDFYTRPLMSGGFQMEANMLRDYMARYKKSNDKKTIGTPDIVCECALCLKLVDSKLYYTDIEWAKNYFCNKIKKSKDGIICNFADAPTLTDNEHTNILYILLNLM